MAAGVSLATASRALDPTSEHPLRSETRARVVAAAEQLAYQPNPMARGLRTRRMASIAILVHDVTDPYFAEIVRGAAEEAYQAGYLVSVCATGRDADKELHYVGMLRQSGVSAILFAGGELDSHGYRAALRRHVIGIHEYGGMVVALAPRRDAWPTEVTDNCHGARLMTEHLASLGHRNIACVAGPASVLTSRDRLNGYLEAMQHIGAEPLVERGDFTIRGGAAATSALLERRSRCTALFISSDTMAIGALSELRERRIAVPEDLSVAGFGGIPTWAHGETPLTTVETHLTEIGAAGIRRALAELNGGSRGPRVNVHPVSIVERGSVRALPPHLVRSKRHPSVRIRRGGV